MTPATRFYAKLGEKRHPVASFEDASMKWLRALRSTGLGSSKLPSRLLIVDEHGTTVAHVSYNGRVWPGVEWSDGAAPLYDSRVPGGTLDQMCDEMQGSAPH